MFFNTNTQFNQISTSQTQLKDKLDKVQQGQKQILQALNQQRQETLLLLQRNHTLQTNQQEHTQQSIQRALYRFESMMVSQLDNIKNHLWRRGANPNSATPGMGLKNQSF